MSETIRLKFEGGIATDGELHFYEYSRSQYGTARFIATIEHFRRHGEVAERISSGSYVDIRVRSAERGSFIEDVVVPALQEGMAAAISTPLSALISYVWHLLSPRKDSTDETIVQLAQIRLAEEVQKTEQERLRTEQLQVMQQIAEGGRATAKDALDLAKWAIESKNAAIGRLELAQSELPDIAKELEAEASRESEFKEYESQLADIDEETMNQLTSRLRPIIKEMALPLKRSAKQMSIGAANDNRKYVHMDPSIVRAIQSRRTEENIVGIEGHVKSYDRDLGVGKVKSDIFSRPLNFVVPIADRKRLRNAILTAMTRDKTILLCRRVLDESGLPTSLIVVDVDNSIPDSGV